MTISHLYVFSDEIKLVCAPKYFTSDVNYLDITACSMDYDVTQFSLLSY